MNSEEFGFSLTPDDKLFIESGYPRAWLNRAFQGFGDLADCYQRSAITLIDVSLRDRSEMDHNIYPILFIVRHYVELRFKELIQGLNFIESKSFKSHTHKLQSLWQIIRKQYSEVIGWNIDDSTLNSIGNLVNELSGLDPDSMTFRYPVDKEGNKFKKPEYINLRNLRVVFISLTELLDSMAMQVDHYADLTTDMISDMYTNHE